MIDINNHVDITTITVLENMRLNLTEKEPKNMRQNLQINAEHLI